MSSELHLKAGDLDAALESLQQEVRARPQDAKLRIYLFQLLCVRGDWQRAIAQLKLSAELDADALLMAQAYREAIICEVYREKVFAGEKTPPVFGEPEPWLALLIEAQAHLAAGRHAAAAELRAEAFDKAPAASGTLNGQRFEWIADADMRLGPVLEIIVNGRYFWLPFSRIGRITAEPPTDLRDAVWTAVQVTLANGGQVPALVPTRYAGTAITGTDAEKLSRATGWNDVGADTFTGIGQRLIATDAGETALLDLRDLQIDSAGAGHGG